MTWVLKKEFMTCEEFDRWYETQIEAKFKDEILKKFVKMRNVSLKEEPINLIQDIFLVLCLIKE